MRKPKKSATKPPLGVLRRDLFKKQKVEQLKTNGWVNKRYLDNQRLNDLKGAIRRYMKVNKEIPKEWLEEYNERIEINVRQPWAYS